MKKILSLIAVFAVMFMFTGCNELVPAGHKGKILGANGWQPEVFPPSKVWLDNNAWNFTPEKLFLIETTTRKYSEPIKVLLKDKLTLTAVVVFRGRVTGADSVVNGLFNDMQMDDRIVTTDEVYHVYGKMVILNTAREIISKYNVDEVNINYARITAELYAAIKPKLIGLPIEISDVTIGSIQYPQIVTDAIDKAKERRMEIEQTKAQVQIDLAKIAGKEEVAKAEYRIKMMEAKRIADYNKKIGEGVTKDLLMLRQLEVQEKMVEAIKDNKNVVYMPFDMMNGATHMRTLQ